MTNKKLLVWISPRYETEQKNARYVKVDLKCESLAEIIDKLMDGHYPGCLALWYLSENNEALIAFDDEKAQEAED